MIVKESLQLCTRKPISLLSSLSSTDFDYHIFLSKLRTVLISEIDRVRSTFYSHQILGVLEVRMVLVVQSYPEIQGEGREKFNSCNIKTSSSIEKRMKATANVYFAR